MNSKEILDSLNGKWKESSAKCSDMNAKIQTALLDDSFDPEDFKKMKDELSAEKVRRDGLKAQCDEVQKQLDAVKPQEPKPAKAVPLKNAKSDKEKSLDEAKAKINAYAHRQFHNDINGVQSGDVAPIIPEEIIYNPQAEVNSVVDLSSLVTKTPVTTAKGTYPILKRANDTFPSTAELKDNPDLAKPNFTEVPWTVSTHRGALGISQESIDDSAVDLTGIIGQQMNERTVNTYNADIAVVLEGFTAKTSTNLTLVDDLKHILNVDLDPAYSPSIVASQSLYNMLDTLKDAEGQYIFHQDVTGGSGATLLGVPVHKVGDTLLGKAGEFHAFIGDLGRAVLFADRKQVSLSWEYDQAYGQYLAGVLRYGVSVADANAGYFLTATVASTPASGK